MDPRPPAAAPPLGSLESLRELNRRRIIATLRELGTTSRAEIARRTGLSRSTVSTVVGDLIGEGLVVERAAADGAPRGGGGRPALPLALSPTAGAALGIDLGHRRLRVAVSDLGHAILAEHDAEIDIDGPARENLDHAAALARRALADAGVDRDRLVGAVLCLPAPIHRTSGIVGAPTLLPSFTGVRVEEEISARLGFRVSVENDANMAALAEHLWGAGRGSANLALIKIGIGIGAGMIVDGQIYRGPTGMAGEIGHTTIDQNGPVCRCGNRGCLEMTAGVPAILEQLRQRHGAPVSVEEVLDLAERGDRGCRRVIADAGRDVGLAVANLLNLLDVDRIVVGGQLIRADRHLLDPLRESVRRCAVWAAAEETEIVFAELGARAEVLGALATVLRDADRFATAPPARAPALPA